MAESSIQIEGKEYLTTVESAKLVGYTKDYVGQLAREGWVVARQVGRIWYIEKDSVLQHKKETNYTLVKKKKRGNAKKAIENIAVSAVPSYGGEKLLKTFNSFSHSPAVGKVEHAIQDISKKIEKGTHEAGGAKNDPLIYANITYEGGTPVFYDDYAPNIPTLKEATRPDEIINPVNKEDFTEFKKEEEKEFGEDISKNAFTPLGVHIIAGHQKEYKKNIPEHHTVSQKKDVQKINLLSKYTEYTEKNNSKRIPVVAGILVFLCFVLIRSVVL